MSVDEFVFDPDHRMTQFVYQSVSQSLCDNQITMQQHWLYNNNSYRI